MYLLTSNEKNSLTMAQIQQDVTAVYAASALEPIVGWQEIITPERHDAIKSREPAGTTHLFYDLPIPISVPSGFEVLETFFEQTKVDTSAQYSTGKAPRWFAIAKLQIKSRMTLKPFYVCNTHFTNGGQWEDATKNNDPQTVFLRGLWMDHWNQMKPKLDELKGFDSTVFGTGDYNRAQAPAFGTAQKQFVGANAIDKVWAIDRSVDTTLVSTYDVVTTSDHDGHGAKVDLTARP